MEEHTRFSITLEAQHDLRCSIPSRRNIFGHVACILFWIHREASSETKVTDLQFTVGVDQQVAWLKISVQDIRGVNVLQAA